MTNSEINSVVMIAVAFLIGGVLMAFIATGVAEADKKASNKVQLHNQDQLNQLIMYNTLIAHVCDDSVAAGSLDNTGSRRYDSWGSYKKLWTQRHVDTMFDDLNKTFPRQELNCIGTGTTFGATSPGNFIDPTSKEWRNDMEGKHSRVSFVINSTKNWYTSGQGDPYDVRRPGAPPSVVGNPADHPTPSNGEVYTPPCFWFDQPEDAQELEPRDSPNAGWEGITDAAFVFKKPDEANFYSRFWGNDPADQSPSSGHFGKKPHGCETPWIKTTKGSETSGKGRLEGGPLLMVTVLSTDGSLSFNNRQTMKGSPVNDEPADDSQVGDKAVGASIKGSSHRFRDGNNWVEYRYNAVKLCEGMRGYIQTNTGYTVPPGGDPFANERPPPYRLGNLPGFGDKERWNPENAPKDNSLHPVIVITDKGQCS